MLGSIPTNIPSKWEVIDDLSGHVFVKLEKKGEGCLGDEEMGRFTGDVVARHTAFRSVIQCQVLFDRKMRKLYHWRAVHIYDGNQARASRQHRISWPLVPLECETPSFEFEREEFGELFNTKRMVSNHSTLEEPMGIFPNFIVDVQ